MSQRHFSSNNYFLNTDKMIDEASLFLKQGYYDYEYAVRQKINGNTIYNSSITEQDAWETENTYMVLV